MSALMLTKDMTEDFRLGRRAEISAMISDIAWSGTSLTIHTACGRIVNVRALCAGPTDQRLILDRGASTADEHALATSSQNRFHCALRGAPVMFDTGSLKEAQYDGHPVFEVPFPDAFYYLQRRRHFRAPVDPSMGFSCTLKLAWARRIRMDIVDVSLSGVRLRSAPEDHIPLAKDTVISGAELDFGTLGRLAVDICVKGCWPGEAEYANGVLYGCTFIDLPVRNENQLQRIVTSLELQAANRHPSGHPMAEA